jgi:hypothetical protein
MDNVEDFSAALQAASKALAALAASVDQPETIPVFCTKDEDEDEADEAEEEGLLSTAQRVERENMLGVARQEVSVELDALDFANALLRAEQLENIIAFCTADLEGAGGRAVCVGLDNVRARARQLEAIVAFCTEDIEGCKKYMRYLQRS